MNLSSSSSKSGQFITFTIITIFLWLSIFSSQTQGNWAIFQEDNGLLDYIDINHEIISIKTSTYNQTLTLHPKLLIIFYTNWSLKSINLQSEYTKLNKLLTDPSTSSALISSQVQMAKINIDEEAQLGDLANITQVPTIIFYHNGQPISKYTDNNKNNGGGDTAENEFLDWLISVLNDKAFDDNSLVNEKERVTIPKSVQEYVNDFILVTYIIIALVFCMVFVFVCQACFKNNRHGGGGRRNLAYTSIYQI